MDVSGVQYTTISPINQTATLKEQATIEASSKDISLTGQPVWEIEMIMDRPRACTTAAFPAIPSEEEAEEAEDFGLSKNVMEEIKAVNMTPCIADKLEKADEDLVLSQSLNGSVTLGPQPELLVSPAMQEQSGLFDPQNLQRVVTSCEIPEQRTTLEGSQVGDWGPFRDVGTHQEVHRFFYLNVLFFPCSANPS